MIRRVNALLPAGKLHPSLLARLLSQLPTDDPALLVGPAVGEDAAVIDFAPGSADLLVAKSDPITFATDAIGYYAVNVCANDLAVSGAQPRFYIPTLLLPAGRSDAALAERIFTEIGAACRALGVTVAGGHSEITHAVNQPVVAGFMLGVAPRTGYLHSGGAQPGDLLLLAGEIPVEGASLIARERGLELIARGWHSDDVTAAANLLHDPGISVLVPARAASSAGLVTAMHDPTEGGVVTGIAEMATAAHVSIEVALDAIPVHDLARRLCAEFGLNPLGTIASGALLATCAPQNAAALQQAWQNVGWRSAVIGTVTARAADGTAPALCATVAGESVPYPQFATDEITRLYA